MVVAGSARRVFLAGRASREETLPAFVAAYATVGFVVCEEPSFEAEFKKIAIFALGGIPTHAARQLPNGKWTSKLGEEVDIEHDDVAAVAGSCYGDPVLFLRRPLPVRRLLGETQNPQ